MDWRREGQHSAGNIDHEYADGRNMQEGQRSTNPGLQWKANFVQAGTRGLSGADASDRERSWNRKIRDSRKW